MFWHDGDVGKPRHHFSAEGVAIVTQNSCQSGEHEAEERATQELEELQTASKHVGTSGELACAGAMEDTQDYCALR